MGTIIQRGAGQYRAQIRRAGQSVSKTFETHKQAADWLRIIEGKITGGEVYQKGAPATVRQACEWMMNHLPKNPNSQNLPAHYRYWMASNFGNWALTSIHEWDLSEWVQDVLDLENAGSDGIGPKAAFSAQTAIHRLNALSQMYQVWGRAHKVTLDNPVKPGTRPSKPGGRARRLLPDEEARLLDAADKGTRPWLRHAIIIAIETAMRQSEQAELEWSRVNLEQGYLDLLKTKNDRPRRVPLSPRAIEAFKALRHYARPTPVSTRHGIVQAFMDVRDKHGFKDLRWHDLRHEAISRLFEDSDFRDIEIMAISGHLTTSMLLRYSHLRTHRLADRLPGGKLNPRPLPPSPAT